MSSVRDEIARWTESDGAGAIALRRPVRFGGPTPAARLREAWRGLAARACKRAVDVGAALVLVVLLSPLWLMIAMLIKVDTQGPILFRQRRIGQNGEAFWILKFRTMVEGADQRKHALRHLNEAGAGLFKINGDPRITRIGGWLRTACLDELPQLLHVLTGRMSLVGPRPLVPEEDALITGRDRCRLSMRPGMTGVWQLGADRSTPIEELAELDRGYVERWSPWTDLKLLARTAAFVLRRRGL